MHRCTRILLLIALVSCSRQTEFNSAVEKSDVRVFSIPTECSSPDFRALISKVRFVPLETRDEAIFRDVFDMVHANGRIFIFDMTLQELFVFKDDGKFLFPLSKRGKGPEEYQEMRDFDVADNGDIYVLSSRKILIYDSERNFKDQIEFTLPGEYHINPIHFARASNGFYLYSGSMGIKQPTEGQYAVYEVDKTGNFVGKVYFPVTRNIIEKPRFYKVSQEQSYTMTPIVGNDTVYKFTGDRVYPAYFLDYGERALPAETSAGFKNGEKIFKAFTTTRYVTSTSSIVETSKYLSFTHHSQNTVWFTLCSKNTGNTVCFPATGNNGHKDFFPRICSGNASELVGYLDAFSLINSHKSGSFKKTYGHLPDYQSLEQTISSLNENDNPVLTIVTLNDF